VLAVWLLVSTSQSDRTEISLDSCRCHNQIGRSWDLGRCPNPTWARWCGRVVPIPTDQDAASSIYIQIRSALVVDVAVGVVVLVCGFLIQFTYNWINSFLNNMYAEPQGS